MRELRKLVRSPRHLLVFEAAARHASFTRAAEELNVSQPAVSLAIRQLETSLGVDLFTRGHRTVALTESGEILFNDVATGFGRMLETAQLLQRKSRQDHVTLSVSTAFANYWVVPRLTDFRTRHPDIDLRLQVSDRDLDLAEEQLSLGIRRGGDSWKGYGCIKFADEELFPVASPDVANKHLKRDDPALLAADKLIHLEEPFRPVPSWRDWFAEMDVELEDDDKGLRLNDYALVLQAAMAGEGIAIGWSFLVEHLLEQGLLVRIGTRSLKTGNDFYLIWSNRTPLLEQAATVKQWLVSSASPRRGNGTAR